MLFNILTRDTQKLAEQRIDAKDAGRLVFNEPDKLKDGDNYIVSLDNLFGYRVSKDSFAPILDKIVYIVYNERNEIKSTGIYNRVVVTVDGIPFIQHITDDNGNIIDDQIIELCKNNVIIVQNTTEPLVSHRCPQCGNIYFGDRCEPCYQKKLAEARRYRSRQGYSWKPDPIFNQGDKRSKVLHMGYELEMEDYHGEYDLDPDDAVEFIHEKLNKNGDDLTIYCKSDGSLRDGGVEMVSHPRTLDYFMKRKPEFEETYNKLREEGWVSEKGGDCGMHVHIDKAFLGKDVDYVCAKIGYIFALFWDELFCISRRTERGLGYCAKNDIKTTDDKQQIIRKIKDQKCESRYVAVNNQPKHTLEIRLWRGTLNTNMVMATLDLTRAIVLCAKKYSINTLQRISFGDIINKMKYEENKNVILARLTKKGVTARLTPTRKSKKEGN